MFSRGVASASRPDMSIRSCMSRFDWRERQLSSIHDVIAAIDVEGLAGDQAGSVMREEGCCDAHIVDADQAARGSLRLRLVEQLIEFRYARGGARGERARRDGVHADALGAEL